MTLMKQAQSLLLFGATGDLSQRMLLPSLYNLDADGLLPATLRIIGTARSAIDNAGFRDFADKALSTFNGSVDAKVRARFLARLHYIRGDVSNADDLAAIASETGRDAAIYLSTSPQLFGGIVDGLSGAGLASTGSRLALEKPLGSDLLSSCKINDAVAASFPENRIFRIDHYLGKATVQNLLALRFANSLFEPLWNSAHIDHVQISIAETVGLEGRANYYDEVGALRDMVQNHMLQLLALVAMEPPSSYDAAAIRNEKVKVLQALRPIDRHTAAACSVTGQYGEGAVSGKPVPGYAEELGKATGNETFVALKAYVDNWRWKGVPFYLRTGKRLPTRKSEIYIQFKCVPHSIFAGRGGILKANKLVIGLQPEETIRLLTMTKEPGLDRSGIRLKEVPLDLSLSDQFASERRRIAYERLLLDLIEGDQTLFVRRDEVEAAWTWIDAIRDGWQSAGITPRPYAAGTWGPSASIALTERDGVSWHD